MSTQTSNLQLIKPDVNDFYDISAQNDNMDKIDAFCGRVDNPHKVTKSQVGLGSVPNVATNDQTPTYTVASSNANLTSGEKISVAFGKIAKAISSLISHLADNTTHITSAERTSWNGKLNATGTATDSDKLDGHHASDFLEIGGGTVTGVTRFTNTPWGINVEKTNFGKGDIPTENTFWAVNMMDKNGVAHTNRVGLLQTLVDTTGATVTQVHAMRNEASSSETAMLTIHCLKDGTKYAQAPTPTSATDNSTKIATTAWVNGFALPKGGTAAKATADASGNNIVSTYRKKTDGAVVKIQETAPTDTTTLWVW